SLISKTFVSTEEDGRMKRIGLLVLLVLLLLAALANSVTINFDNPAEFTSVTMQYSGLTFSNATVLTAGTSLSEFENPPHSGANVIFACISISLATAITSFSGCCTYGEPARQNFTHLVLRVNTGNNLVASVSSAFSNTQRLSGDPAVVQMKH